MKSSYKHKFKLAVVVVSLLVLVFAASIRRERDPFIDAIGIEPTVKWLKYRGISEIAHYEFNVSSLREFEIEESVDEIRAFYSLKCRNNLYLNKDGNVYSMSCAGYSILVVYNLEIGTVTIDSTR